MRQLVLLAPADVKPIAHAAEQAVVRTLSRDSTSHDTPALYALAQLVAEMDACEISEATDLAAFRGARAGLAEVIKDRGRPDLGERPPLSGGIDGGRTTHD